MRKGGSDPVKPIPTRLPHLQNYQARGHKLDKKLWDECAYYPQEGCQYCRWDWPYPKCGVAHILVDTRCAGVRGWKPDHSAQQEKKKPSERMKKEKFWNELPRELQRELEKIMKGGETG